MLRVEPGGSKKPVVVTRPASPRTAPPSKSKSAPAIVSEHGRGGGSAAADTGRKPTAAETRTGYTAPAGTKAAAVQPTPAVTFVSEHGQGGGSSSSDTGRKPTAAETRTGFTAPVGTKAAELQPAPAAALISEHGQGGGSVSGDTGRKPTAAETRTGYTASVAAKAVANQPARTVTFVSEHGYGGGSRSADTGRAPTAAETRTGYSVSEPTHKAHGLGGLLHHIHSDVTQAASTVKQDVSKAVHVVTHEASPAVRAIERDAAKVAKTVKHLAPKVVHASEGVAVNTGRLIEDGAKTFGKAELRGLRADAKLGKEIVTAVEKNPSTVAWVAGTLALLTPPPLDVELAVISAVASADAGAKDWHDRKYVALAFDITAFATGAAGGAARASELLANAQHAATAARLNALTEGLAATKEGTAVRGLSDRQESALRRLTQELDRTRGAAHRARELRLRRDVRVAVAAFVGDPRVDPAARARRR